MEARRARPACWLIKGSIQAPDIACILRMALTHDDEMLQSSLLFGVSVPQCGRGT